MISSPTRYPSSVVPVASRSVSSVNVQIPRPASDPVAGPAPDTITGTVDLPGDVAGLSPEDFRAANVPVALFAHCFTCNRNVPAAFRISKTLARHGIACLRIDFSSLLFSENLADLESAARWLDQRLAAPSLLVGHSLGGAAVLQVAHRLASVRAAATIGAPLRPASAARTLMESVDAVDRAGREAPQDAAVQVTLTGREITLPTGFFTDLADNSDADRITHDVRAISANPADLLVLHSPTDQTVPVSESQRIFDAAGWPKSLMSLRDSDHLLTRRGSAVRAGEMIADWFNTLG